MESTKDERGALDRRGNLDRTVQSQNNWGHRVEFHVIWGTV